MNSNFSPNIFENITFEESEIATGYNPLFVCPTPPESVRSVNTPSPCTVQNVTTSGVLLEGIPNYAPMNVSSPEQLSSAAMLVPCRYQSSDTPNGNYSLSASLPVGGAEHTRRPTRRPQLTSAHRSEASIMILNPRLEYDKIQKKHGPRGKYSEQRIQNGQVCVKCARVGKINPVFVILSYEPNSYGNPVPRFSHLPPTSLAPGCAKMRDPGNEVATSACYFVAISNENLNCSEFSPKLEHSEIKLEFFTCSPTQN